jgi:hypothetical protein
VAQALLLPPRTTIRTQVHGQSSAKKTVSQVPNTLFGTMSPLSQRQISTLTLSLAGA